MGNILAAVAWPYANGPRHIGHVSGFGIPSDVFSRYQRMTGNRVLMVSGTDEHGTPILVQAENEGVEPQVLADRYNRIIVEDLVALGLSYDLFTRTTTRNHHAVAQELFTGVHRNGYLISRTTPSAISPTSGRTLPDRYIEGTCPLCDYDSARGDQCDNCGKQLDPQDLINPRSRINGETPNFIETEHFFLDLPALAEQLSQWLSTRTDWRPNVLNFAMNLMDEVQPRAMTRDIDWGIRIPIPGWTENQNKRLYVWFDAVVGYLSASIEWARRYGVTEDEWKDWWSADRANESFYFMGKDNITFHTQIWPAELLAYNENKSITEEVGKFGQLSLPTEIVSSEFLTMGGRKFATSRGTVILVRDVLERYSADSLRYFIAIAGPETRDTDFTWDEFYRRNNTELVGAWGNLVNRSISLAAKNFGAIPQPEEFTEDDLALLESAKLAFEQVGTLIRTHHQKAAISAIMQLVSQTNKYLHDQEPWKVKDNPGRQGTILYVALQVVSDCNTMFTPFIPHSAQLIFEQLGGAGIHSPMPKIVEAEDLDGGPGYPIITGDYTSGGRWASIPLHSGTELRMPTPVFQKLDMAGIEQELERMA